MSYAITTHVEPTRIAEWLRLHGADNSNLGEAWRTGKSTWLFNNVYWTLTPPANPSVLYYDVNINNTLV